MTFDVLGQNGLGLTMLVPDGADGVKEVLVHGADGPWRQDPPPGTPYSTEAEMDQLRTLSQTLVPG